MFRSSFGQRSGSQIVGVFSSADLPRLPDIISTFSYTGANQSLTIPAGYNFIEVFAWGAGGGGGFYSAACNGGAGGYTSAIIPVTPLETLPVIVGAGGTSSDYGYQVAQMARLYGFGGLPTSTNTAFTGHGGGLTAIKRGSIWLLVAAGGGGGGCEAGADGGAGGGTNGVSGSASGAGLGGTQLAGGAGSDAGTQGQGGDASGTGGTVYRPGGGAGWWGGGAPTAFALGATAGAGGGSGYAVSGSTGVILIAGSGTTPGNNNSGFYVGGAGIGGVSNTTPGGNGYMRVRIFQ